MAPAAAAPAAPQDGTLAAQAEILPDDPSLPDDVAYVPSLAPRALAVPVPSESVPGAPQQVAAAPQAPAQQQPTDVETAIAQATPAEAAPPPPQQQQPSQFIENTSPEQVAALAPPPPPKKRGLLSFFTSSPAPQPAARSQPARRVEAPPAPKPLVQLASTGPAPKPVIAAAAPSSMDALPGVRQDSLFEIKRRSGTDDDSDIDVHEGEELRVASFAPGLARLAPNGLLKQTEHVDVACLKPSLVRVLKAVEQRFGKKVVITSGYRSPDRNRRARGARNSLHMYCAAADVQVPGVSKLALAQYVRAMPGRGGVGTYCHTESVHIDVGPERDWNWRCRRRR